MAEEEQQGISMHAESTRPTSRGMEIAPLHGLRYDLEKLKAAGVLNPARAVVSPPYDVISPEEHRMYLGASPFNITWLTLGSDPTGTSSYEERGSLLRRWIEDRTLVADDESCFYVYAIDYVVPGSSRAAGASNGRARFLGLIALGKLYPFEAGVVHAHEKTFPRVVEDRLQLLDATRANLESILLLYSDREGEIDGILSAHARGAPLVRVEAKPGEFHAIYRISDVAVFIRLMVLFLRQRPIIADGHHRYTTSLRFCGERGMRCVEDGGAGNGVPGSGWQMMTFANLYGEGLSILATHRLITLPASNVSTPAKEALLEKVLGELSSRLAPSTPEDAHFRIETRSRNIDVRFPAQLLESKRGVARTSYALIHDVVLDEWLKPLLDGELGVRYFKEGTGETEALQRGEGDILFRMKPVDRGEFEAVVQGGEVFPHKTTYFYPKLWSGLVLWPLEEPERLALK